MADAALHPKAVEHLPMFITAPGDTDVLMVVMAWILAFCVLGFGVLFFRLHSLPEHIAHKSHKVQMEIVSVLCLISLFTHMHIFWIIGLILAFIDIPDFGTPLKRIAGGVEKIAGVEPPAPETAHAAADPAVEPRAKDTDGAATSKKPAGATAAAKKEPSHA
jgi:amino acid transporter